MGRVLLILALAVCLAGTSRADPPYQRVANTTLAMPSTPPSYGYTLTNAFGSLYFNDPVCIASPPGETNRLFVVERGGTIAVITNLASPTRSVFLNIFSEVTNLEECGLLCLTFHPGYATNGYFYVYYTGPDSTAAGTGQHDILSRFTVTATNANVADPTSEVKIIRQYDRGQFHNGGDLHFGTDGYLYFSIGDENCCNDPFGNSQIIDKNFFSGMFRIDVDKKPGNLTPNPNAAITANYLVPADNPFIGTNTFNGTNINTATLRTEFWAVGMRNPWRFSFDPPTGLLYLGDVGQDAQEEVDIVTKGGNYGWAYREGSIAGPKANPPTNSAYKPISPILSYAHGSATNQGNCVIGGLVYRGTQLSQLVGCYVFGDNVDGNIWTLQYNGTNATNWQRILGAVGISTFGADPRNGDILVALRGVEGSGTNVTTQPLQRLVYSSTVTGSPLPATLNDTGAFSNLTSLTPNAGIVSYSINVPFWSDNAVKSRWFSIPNTNLTIGYNPTNNWTFPPGTVWIKHFDLQTNSSPPMSTRVETRLLVRNSNGVYGVTYRWAGGTNATLVPEGGMDDTFIINNGGVITTQNWHYPARAECAACHTPVAGLALGLNAPQMDLNMTYTNGTFNQLQVLSDVGYFSSPVTNIPAVTPLAAATDTTTSLEYRSRSYLAANCVQCHQPGGTGLGLWDARFSTPLAQAGLINGPLLNNFGDTNNCVIKPGSLSNSVLLTRVSNLGTFHMPPLATSVINTSAVQLLSAWISNSASVAQLAVSPPSLDFGLVAVSNTVQASFAVTNLGGTAITNGTAVVSAPFAIVSGSPFNLAGSTGTNVVVSFTPTNAAFSSNNVTFTSTGGNSTNVVTGTGTPPAQLGVSPAGVSFGLVAVSNTVQASFTITNLGGIAITNGAAIVSAPFAIVSGSPFNLAGFTSTNVVVSFTPTNTAFSSNNVTFSSNGGNSTNAVTGSGTPPAQLAVSPVSLNFGTVAVSNTVQASFTITNLGGIAITNGAAIVSAPFAIVSGSPFNLAGFTSTNVVVSFTPTNTIFSSNNVVFASNGGNKTNAVTGTGTPPAQLAVSPVSLNFGTVAVSNTVQASFTITNLGGIAITNGAAVVSAPFAIVSGSPFNLAGFAVTNVVVSFTPTNTGYSSNNVTFTSNGGNSTNVVTGTGTPPAQLSVSPVSLSFGTVAVSNTVQASFAITNLGGIAITNGVAVVSAPFAIVSGSPFNLAGFAATNVVVSFTPTNTGYSTNNVVFSSNGGNKTNAVTGSGTPPAQLAVSPASLSFGTVVVSNTVQASFAITNLGGIAITNGAAVVSAPFAIVSGSTFNLAGFTSTNVVVSFTPTNTGYSSNNVTFTSNGGNGTNAVTGSGTPPAQLAVSPMSLSFGTVAVSNSVQASFTITNLGGIAITNGAAVVGAPFAIVSGSPINLAGFTGTNVVVNFTPVSTGNFSNNVTFTSNGGNSTNAVTGSGTPPAQLAVSPISLSFGTVAVSNTVQASFTITNLGGIAITNGAAVVSAPFAIVSGSTFNLAGFAATNVVVSFMPISNGNFSNSVTFTSNGGNRTNAVTGTGTPPAQLAVSPASLSFGTVAVSNMVQASFAITNLGGIAITNGAAVVSAPFAIVSGSPFNLAGFTGTNVLVSFTPISAGDFSDNVTFTSNGGNSTNAVAGTGALPPVASFSGSPTSGAWPLLVVFTNNSSGTITNAFWIFGDGANTNTPAGSVAHNYALAGTNTVTLTVSGPVGTNTETLPGYIVVTEPPPVMLSISISGKQVQLTWPQGTLQSADQVGGAYGDLTNGSPFFVTPSNSAQYYRVRVR